MAVLTAEWTKIRSLRSTLITLAMVFVISVGTGVLNGASVRAAINRGSGSLAAMPRRGLLYASKIIVAAAIALALTYLTAFAAFLAAQQALGPYVVSRARRSGRCSAPRCT